MTAAQYQKAAVRTIGTFEGIDDRLAFCAMEIMSESGEVANLAYKHLWQGHELDKHKIMHEIGDVMWGVAAFTDGIGCTLKMPLKRVYTNASLYADSTDRLTRTVLRLGKWVGILTDGVNGYLVHGSPQDVRQFNPVLELIFEQLCALADTLGFTPQEVMEANIAKLARRYPQGFSSADSIARVDTGEAVQVGAPDNVITFISGPGYQTAQLPDGRAVYRFDQPPAEE
jgi:NTP pyrophosphatase (non-canonical NTP hydrolase)